VKILKWYELKGNPGYYWLFNQKGEKDVVRVCDGIYPCQLTYTGYDGIFEVCEEDHAGCDFVLIEAPDISKQKKIDVFAQCRAFQHANGDSKFPEKVEGYWRQHEDVPTFVGAGINMLNRAAREGENYPWPVVWNIPEFDVQEFINRLADVEDTLAQEKRYRGCSLCRLTKVNRGNGEYEYKGWKWPSGLIDYVRMGVPVSRAFFALIMDVSEEDCKYLPTYNRE